jgi:hypothetical protein
MAAMARNPAGFGLAVDDRDVAQAEALQLGGCGEAGRTGAQDDDVAGDHSFNLSAASAVTLALQ